MGGNSLARRVVKRLLRPLLGDGLYGRLQAASMARDIRNGTYSEPELALIPFVVGTGETVLDIGANYGLYSYYLGRAVGVKGRVYAFEPVPFTASAFRHIARDLKFSSVTLIPKGCGNENHRVKFRIPLQESGALSAGLTHIATRDDTRAGKETQVRWNSTCEIECEIVKLDDELGAIGEVSFIKCDIEGAELSAFCGARSIIARSLPIVLCEINPWYLEGFGTSVGELTKFFFDQGYRLYKYEGDLQSGMLVETRLEEVVEDNYVFVHPSRENRLAPLLAERKPT